MLGAMGGRRGRRLIICESVNLLLLTEVIRHWLINGTQPYQLYRKI